MSTLHPRASLNAVSSWRWGLDEDLALWRRLRVHHVGIPLTELEPHLDRAVTSVRSNGIAITTVVLGRAFHLGDPHAVEAARQRLLDNVGALHAAGIESAYVTTGPSRRGMTIEASLDHFCAAVGPVVDHARSLGVALAVEHNSTMTHDTSCIHSVADAVAVARATGLGVVVELQNCWLETGLRALFRKAMAHIDLVQVSDFVVGTDVRLSRACPGDGDIPIEHLMALLLDAGYDAMFELEILGPDIEAEGYGPAIARSMDWLSTTLERLGA
jgi:sugar phosphate isomerase/epimerase